jgi:predicted unusual protein kinase regulating ubiquinone biosynthesis (AarF/ABC1/UbiB family)
VENRTKPLSELAKGFRARTLVTAKLATRLGMSAAKAQFGNGATQAGELSPEDAARAAKRAEDLVAELGRLKGVVMKFGQMASYLPGSLPPAAQRILANLQANSTPMAYESIARVIQEDLGQSPESLYAEFERAPFAAASIGQVHRAVVDGRRVAVKVQYPGIDSLLEGDLDTVRKLASFALLGSSMSAGQLVKELRERMREECDYRNEAKNTELFGALLAENRDASVPRVLRSHSARRVITTEFVEARGFYEFCDGARQEAKDRAGLTIFRTCFESIFKHCVYNADPHPGNYLFADDGHVTLLDFGCVRRFDPAMIELWKGMASAIMDSDQPAFRKYFQALGLVGNAKRFDHDAQWEQMKYLYRPYLEPGFRYSHEYVRESYKVMIFKNANRQTLAMPGEWLFLNRLQWGLNAVLAHLGAGGPYPETWRAILESRPVPAS